MTNRILFLTVLILWACSSAYVSAQDNQPLKKSSFEITTWKKGEKPPKWAEKKFTDFKRLKKLYEEASPLANNWLPDGRRERGLAIMCNIADAGYIPAQLFLADDAMKYAHYYSTLEHEKIITRALHLADIGNPEAIVFKSNFLITVGEKKLAKSLLSAAFHKTPLNIALKREYGKWLLNGIYGKDKIVDSVLILTELAKQNDAEANHILLNIYLNGLAGQEKSVDKTLYYAKRAAVLGNKYAAGVYAMQIFASKEHLDKRSEAFKYLRENLGTPNASNIIIYLLLLQKDPVFGCRYNNNLRRDWAIIAATISSNSKKKHLLLNEVTHEILDKNFMTSLKNINLDIPVFKYVFHNNCE